MEVDPGSGSSVAHLHCTQGSRIVMKTDGNGWENPLISAPAFRCRSRSGTAGSRLYGCTEMNQYDRKFDGNGWEAEILVGTLGRLPAFVQVQTAKGTDAKGTDLLPILEALAIASMGCHTSCKSRHLPD